MTPTVTEHDVRRVALSLPETTEKSSCGTLVVNTARRA